jgi:cytochrome c-type biogenesis protein CcmF
MVVSALLGVGSVWTLLAFGLAAFAVAGIVRQFAVGIGAQHSGGASWWRAPARTVGGSPRLYGGLVVHLGIVAIAVALAASSAFTTRAEVRLERGQSATVAGYRVTYLDSHLSRGGQKNTVKADIRIHHGRDDLGVYAPAISTFPGDTTGIATPSVRTGLLRDVYLTLVSSPNETGRITLGVQVNPMVVWIWIGGALVALGAAIALIPQRKRVRTPTGLAPEDLPEAVEREVVTA